MTLLAVVLALTRPLSISGGEADAILLGSAAVLAACLIAQRFFHPLIVRAPLSLALSLGVSCLVSVMAGLYFLGSIVFIVVQGFMYTLWLEVVRYEWLACGSGCRSNADV